MKVRYVFTALMSILLCLACLSCSKESSKISKSNTSNNPTDDDDDDDDDDFKDIQTTYDMSTIWDEDSYGRWKKDTSFSILIKSSSIKTESKKTAINKLRTGSLNRPDDDIVSKVSSSDTMSYKRTKSVDSKSSKSYKDGKYIFLFVDSVKTQSDGKTEIKHEFSEPIPFTPRSDLRHDTFEKYKDETFEYTYTSSVPQYSNVQFKMSCSINVENSHKVTVTVNNNITNYSGKDAAYIYGKFPVLKSTTYVIDTKKKRLLSFTGTGETLISGSDALEEQKRNGNAASVTMESKMVSYEVKE